MPDEEIGGFIWAKPVLGIQHYDFVCDKITFIRNAIEDKPNSRGQTKKNTYLRDPKILKETLKEIFSLGYLPINFHTHPTKGKNPLDEIDKFTFQKETSLQDRKAAEYTLRVGGEQLLLPRGLVVGNNIS